MIEPQVVKIGSSSAFSKKNFADLYTDTSTELSKNLGCFKITSLHGSINVILNICELVKPLRADTAFRIKVVYF